MRLSGDELSIMSAVYEDIKLCMQFMMSNCRFKAAKKTAPDAKEDTSADDVIQSKAMAGIAPVFVWTTNRKQLDVRQLLAPQMANHFAKASAMTTKVRLRCMGRSQLQ
jgi:hypothetical protein